MKVWVLRVDVGKQTFNLLQTFSISGDGRRAFKVCLEASHPIRDVASPHSFLPICDDGRMREDVHGEAGGIPQSRRLLVLKCFVERFPGNVSLFVQAKDGLQLSNRRKWSVSCVRRDEAWVGVGGGREGETLIAITDMTTLFKNYIASVV